MKNFFIYTLGCKVNNCDSNKIANILVSFGFEMSDSEKADVIIINSCAVTSESVRKTRQNINKFKKINKNCFLILTGCAVILEQFLNNRNIDLICDKKNLINKIKEKFGIFEQNTEINFINNSERTRAFIKIEDGCENFCSYCIIPFARGKIKSKNLDEIDFECRKFFDYGFKEFVLTGINLGKYGQDLNLNLIDAIKVARKYCKRIRLSSLEPDVLNKKFIDNLCLFDEVCPSFHLSLQSGSDRILKLMNRKYNINFYLELVNYIKNKFEDATFSTDIIIGYPGETDEDFENTLEIIKKIGIIKVNVFPFSPRPFTKAYNLNQIDSKLKKYRVKKAIEFSELISKKVISNFIGESFEVLFENKEKNNIFSGYSRNYIKIKYKSEENLCGKIKKVIFLPEFT
ncbi:MAG: tRNA (N(6)-L-threonylcarbamoyladenosine(37)-C(2))-methylthiotransferase MtaB [Clostridia bacterium]|nr:tRNA (N(6)-L-threonylcarbamoyladenosine(37)-C(2))-methylthiotransferase MtaB [Clostridia bacterium]